MWVVIEADTTNLSTVHTTCCCCSVPTALFLYLYFKHLKLIFLALVADIFVGISKKKHQDSVGKVMFDRVCCFSWRANEPNVFVVFVFPFPGLLCLYLFLYIYTLTIVNVVTLVGKIMTTMMMAMMRATIIMMMIRRGNY